MKQPTDTGKPIQINIAIADDHTLLRGLIVDNINALPGCQVVLSAAGGDELLQGIEKLTVPPDVCIIDISMPVMNGYDTQLAIKKRWPEMKSLAISIFDDDDCIIEMLRNGADGFVSKQSGVEAIHEALLTVRNGDYYYDQLPVWSFKSKTSLPMLTEREKEYLTLLCSGLNPEKIAQKMDVTTRTLEHYRDNLYQKTKVNNKADLILYVRKTGIVFMK